MYIYVYIYISVQISGCFVICTNKAGRDVKNPHKDNSAERIEIYEKVSQETRTAG